MRRLMASASTGAPALAILEIALSPTQHEVLQNFCESLLNFKDGEGRGCRVVALVQVVGV